MNDFSFSSEDFSVQNSKKYRLSIQLNPDGFSALLSNSAGDIIKLLHRTGLSDELLAEQFRNEPELIAFTHLPYQAVDILFTNPEISLIPEELYDPSLKNLLFDSVFPIEKNDLILEEKLSWMEAMLLFKLGEKQRRFLLLFKNEPTASHIAALHPVSYTSYPHWKNAVFLYVNGRHVMQSCYKDGSLEYLGIKTCIEVNDLVFNVLNVMKQVYGKPDAHPVYYSGSLKSSDEEIAILGRYLRKVAPMEDPLPFEIAGGMSGNYFTPLLEPGS
jgi:hypothetical protein